MVDAGLERAFEKVRAILEGDLEHPGLTLYDLQELVGFPGRSDGPLSYSLPKDSSLEGVNAVRFFYYPKDPEVTLIVEVEDKSRRRHLRHFKWNGITWVAPRGFKADLTATREVVGGIEEIGGDFFLGFSRDEARELSEAIRKGEAVGAKYLLCPRDNTRLFYAPGVSASGLPCPKCGNTTLLYKTLTFSAPEDRIEALIREQRALRAQLEDLMLFLKSRLGAIGPKDKTGKGDS
ncbi:hypothetical protein [Calidithermus timidus]|jgi:hypothetical protein|uniref:hypothetical protein n=1 Tax=Calidithermus timidus TaxID=307124 RepID=UPI00035C33EA|nr:hypothetical protein [Calidithermus timidus]